MRFALAAAAAAVAAAAAFTAPAGARVDASGAQACGGPLATMTDKAAKSVVWSPAVTDVLNIAQLTAPKTLGTRSMRFQKHVWKITAVIERYRLDPSGNLVFELYDIPSNMYMNAYIPSEQCLPQTAWWRPEILNARASFTNICPAATSDWQMLGATADMTGVGYWDPVKSTLGSLPNGAELRPLVGLYVKQGCGRF